MAHASLRPPHRQGPKLRLGRTVAGLICTAAVPSLLWSLAVSNELFADAIGNFFGVFAAFATFGAMSVLVPFLPLILWRLPRSTNSLVTCMVIGMVSGPGPLGYLFAFAGPLILVPTFTMGAIGGLVFWLVAVRGIPDDKE